MKPDVFSSEISLRPALTIRGLTVAQPTEVRDGQPTGVEVADTGDPDGSDLEQRLGPPSRRPGQGENVDEGETLLVQPEEEGGPHQVEGELGPVEFERTDGDLALKGIRVFGQVTRTAGKAEDEGGGLTFP